MPLEDVDPGTLGVLAIAAGLALVVLGTALLVLAGLLGSEGGAGDVEAGGVVFVGPIPIVFGTGQGAVWLALAIAALMVLVYAFVLS